ncbi:MAG: class I SAM-dependent methyltransferase [Candidatus Aenigmarchaeota archaeon]|nr:class I SAM-dependent methyltransferase [Candidatus Aenigmarchaeota archaeon]
MVPIFGKYAKYYDIVNQSYFNWTNKSFLNFFDLIFSRMKSKPRNILILACGTGRFGIPLAKKGFNVTCLDISQEMLNVLKEKKEKEKIEIKIVQGDMTNFSLDEKFDIILCMYNSVYELDEEGLKKILTRVYNHLNEDGIFIFDVEDFSKRKFQKVWADKEELTWIRFYEKDNIRIQRTIYEVMDKEKMNFKWDSFMIIDDSGEIKTVLTRDKFHLLSFEEWKKLLKSNKFTKIECYSNRDSKTKFKEGDQFLTFVVWK